MSEVLNANPTIRSASDLPSRQLRTSPHSRSNGTSLGLLTSTIPSSAYTPDPFSPSSSLSDSDNEADSDAVEPIDEQEIYGNKFSCWLLIMHHLSQFFSALL